jgi:tetratricopeptide (TPR) repeat protein
MAMFGDLDNFYDDDETVDLLKRYSIMLAQHNLEFFDLYEYECIIDYFTEQYNYKDAISAVCLAIRQHPNASSMQLRYVQLLIETSKPGKALGIIRRIGDTESANYELYLAKGIALNMTGKHLEARSSFEKALKLCGDSKDEVAYDIAQSFMQIGMHSVAVKYLFLAYHFNHNNILVLFDLALNYEKLGCPEKSILYYSRYLDLDPFAEHVWNNLGLMYTDMDCYEKAGEAFDYALAINPQFYPAYFDKADMLVLSNNIRGAIAVYVELLEEDSSNTRAMCDMGTCYEQIGDYQRALAIYNQALEISQECSDAWFGLGMIYFRQKKYNISIDNLKKAVGIQPANADYWFMLGKVYSSARKLNWAIYAYSRASELNPFDYEACMECAQVLFRKKRIGEAVNMLIQLYQYNCDNAIINYRLAAYYAYQHNLVEAQRYFKKGLSLNFQEHIQMFRCFPKTKSFPVFKLIIEKHLHQRESLKKLSK